MEIVWSDEAKKTFKSNIKYLQENWEEKVKINFINETDRVLKILSKQPYIGHFDSFFGCRRFLVVKQISVFYEVNEKEERIELITFWDNRKKPIRRLSQ